MRRQSASEWVHLDVEVILQETDKAFLVRLETSRIDLWVPKSQMSDSEAYAKGDKDCTISVTEWFADQKGIGDG